MQRLLTILIVYFLVGTASAFTYTARQGDSCASILQLFNINFEDLKKVNPSSRDICRNLREGISKFDIPLAKSFDVEALRGKNQELEIALKKKVNEANEFANMVGDLKEKANSLEKLNESLKKDSKFAGHAVKIIILLSLAIAVSNAFWGRREWLRRGDDGSKKKLLEKIAELQQLDIRRKGEYAVRNHMIARMASLTEEQISRFEQLLDKSEGLPTAATREAFKTNVGKVANEMIQQAKGQKAALHVVPKA